MAQFCVHCGAHLLEEGGYCHECGQSKVTATPDQKKDSAWKFHLDQLSAIRTEAEKLKEEARAAERYGLLASGAVYTFLFAHTPDNPHLVNFMWWIPPALTFLLGLRSLALYVHVDCFNGYSKEAETSLPAGDLQGWRNYHDKSEKNHLVFWSAALFWDLVLGATTVAACVESGISLVGCCVVAVFLVSLIPLEWWFRSR